MWIGLGRDKVFFGVGVVGRVVGILCFSGIVILEVVIGLVIWYFGNLFCFLGGDGLVICLFSLFGNGMEMWCGFELGFFF